MVEPSKRSRSVKKASKRTPSGKTVIHYKKKKTGKPSCGRCGKIVPPKNKKIYGSSLCSACTEDLLRYAVQWKARLSTEDLAGIDLARDLTVEKYLPRGWYKDLQAGVVKPKKKKKIEYRKPKAKPAVSKETPKKKPAEKKKAAAKTKPREKKPAAKKTPAKKK